MLIQTPRLARKLQRALRLTSLPDSVLAPETVSVIVVEDLSAPLSDEDRGCMGCVSVSAVAGELPIVALVRVGAPASYSLIVTAVWVSSLSTQEIELAVSTGVVTGLAVADDTSFTDFGIPGRPSSQLGFDTRAVEPANRALTRMRILANERIRIPLDIEIGTVGDGQDLSLIYVIGKTANTSIQVSWEWTEKAPRG